MRGQHKNILKVLVVFSVLFIIILNSKVRPSPLRTGAAELGSGALGVSHGASSFFRRLIPFAGYREEARSLKERVAYLDTKLEESKTVQEENQRLRDFLDFRKIVPYQTVPAQVIGRDPSNWSNSLIIDKGANFGLKRNKAVLSTKGLVGRVVEVGRYSSKVLLISDPNSKVGVVILKNRQGGILVGRPDGKCKMIYISLDSDVRSGDKVITGGFGTVFPKDVVVGDVVKVGKEPGRLYKYAIVRPAQDLSKLEEVLCIK